MKLSQFNAFVPHENMVVGYNTLTDHFLALNPMLHDMIKSAEHHGDITEMETIHPQFYAALKEGGFVIDEDKDEVKIVKKIREEVDFTEQVFMLTVNPTMNCNFKCWYCYETHVKGSKMVVSVVDRVIAMAQDKVNTMKDLKHFNLSFFGGEPLLNYRDVVLPLVQGIAPIMEKAGVELDVNFTTNGYLVSQQMIDELKPYFVSTMQITLDGNRQTHDTIRFINKRKGSYDKIMENVKLLLANEIPVRLRINYTRKTLEGIKDIAPDLVKLSNAERKYLNLDFHQVWQDGEELGDMLMDTMKAFQDAGLYSTAPYNFPNNVVSSCYGDKQNSAVINYNGDVYKCTARDFTKKNREGYITETGEIIWIDGKHEKRMDAKFKNKPCLSCFMLPVCNGGCSQHAIEHAGEDYCVYGFDEKKKKQLVLDKFLYKYAEKAAAS